MPPILYDSVASGARRFSERIRLQAELSQPHGMTRQPDCENERWRTKAALLLNAAQIIARSLSKCGMLRRGGVAAFVSFCAFAPLYAEAQMQRDIDGDEHIQRP